MARIRVVPEDLLKQAHEIAGLCILVMDETNQVLKASRTAPPYDGQFGPIVRAIGDSVHSLGRIRSESIKETGIRLTGISEAFTAVDNFAIYSDSLKNMCFENEYDVYYTEEEKRIKKRFPNWVKGQDPDAGTDAFLLWAVCDTKNNGNGFRLIQVGENEWTVLVSETYGEVYNWGKPEAYNSWCNNKNAIEGQLTQFEKAILDGIFMNIPKGSKLNIAGYSQGGIMAFNMYEDLKDHFDVSSVTTFGSPTPFRVELPPKSISRNYAIDRRGDRSISDWKIGENDPIPFLGFESTRRNEIEYILIDGDGPRDKRTANHWADNYMNNETVRTNQHSFSFGGDNPDYKDIAFKREPYDRELNERLESQRYAQPPSPVGSYDETPDVSTVA